MSFLLIIRLLGLNQCSIIYYYHLSVGWILSFTCESGPLANGWGVVHPLQPPLATDMGLPIPSHFEHCLLGWWSKFNMLTCFYDTIAGSDVPTGGVCSTSAIFNLPLTWLQLLSTGIMHGREGKGQLLSNFLLVNWKIFLEKYIGKVILTLRFTKPGWVEQSKVISECILKCNFFMQTDVLYE